MLPKLSRASPLDAMLAACARKLVHLASSSWPRVVSASLYCLSPSNILWLSMLTWLKRVVSLDTQISGVPPRILPDAINGRLHGVDHVLRKFFQIFLDFQLSCKCIWTKPSIFINLLLSTLLFSGSLILVTLLLYVTVHVAHSLCRLTCLLILLSSINLLLAPVCSYDPCWHVCQSALFCASPSSLSRGSSMPLSIFPCSFSRIIAEASSSWSMPSCSSESSSAHSGTSASSIDSDGRSSVGVFGIKVDKWGKAGKTKMTCRFCLLSFFQKCKLWFFTGHDFEFGIFYGWGKWEKYVCFESVFSFLL